MPLAKFLCIPKQEQTLHPIRREPLVDTVTFEKMAGPREWHGNLHPAYRCTECRQIFFDDGHKGLLHDCLYPKRKQLITHES